MNSFTLTLDTQAPLVALSGRQLSSGVLRATVDTNEPAIMSAWALAPGIEPIPGQRSGSEFVFDLAGASWPSDGQIQIDATDEVGNFVTRLFDWATPAYFFLNLDTTAPVLSITSQEIRQGDAVELAYTLNEGVVLAASAVSGGRTIIGTVDSDTITFLIPGETWAVGYVNVDMIDEVGNAATRELVISSAVPQIERTWRPPDLLDVNDYVRAGWTRR